MAKFGQALSLGRVGAMARNTFREAVRTRAFVGLGVFGVAFLAFSLVLSELTIRGQGPRVINDFGFFAISLFGAVTAIVMGAILVHKEIERKTIYTILSKPIWRYEVILGKYFGILSVLAVQVGALAAFWFLVLWLQDAPGGVEHVKGLLLIFMEVAIVAAIAVMFSAMSSPIVTAMFTGGAFVVGRLVPLVEEMLKSGRGAMNENPLLNLLGEGVVRVFPDLGVFNTSQQVLLGIETPWHYIGHSSLYALAYMVITLALAMLAFQRRDLT